MARPPAVVAELGRPETPDETAARKAESSRLYRQRKTFRNLAASLLVSIVMLAAIVLIAPHNDTSTLTPVDYAAAAEQVQDQYPQRLAVPVLGPEWSANGAEIRVGADGVNEWYIGFVVTTDAVPRTYVGMSQGIDANETWVYAKVGNRTPTGTVNVGGLTWDEYDYTSLSPDDAGNTAYSLVTRGDDGSMFILYGAGDDPVSAVQTLAAQIAAQRGQSA